MGLGVYYTAELPKRGWLRKSVASETLRREMSDLAREAVITLGLPLVDWFWSHHEGDCLWLNIVPFEENITVEVNASTVLISAKTSGAGPGYHEFVVDLLDRFEQQLGLLWRGEGEEDGDETGYRKSRDRRGLREQMASQLSGIASVVTREIGTGVQLNMGLDWSPVWRAYASSVLGDWSEEWMRSMAGAEDEAALKQAEEFFPWWGTGLGPEELAKFGKVLCWTEVNWVKPQSKKEEVTLRTALACLERARDLGATGVPDMAVAELRRLLDPQRTADETAPAPIGIGYRRRELQRRLTGHWTLQVPGHYHDEVEDEGATLVYWFGRRTIRLSTVSFEPRGSLEEVLEIAGVASDDRLEGLAPGLAGSSATSWDESEQCFITRVRVVAPKSLCSMTFAHQEETDGEWALSIARTAKHPSATAGEQQP